MSLMRQVWLLVLSVIVLACAGSVAVSVWSARSYLQNQLALKNSDNAQALALSLSQQRGDMALMELTLAAQFDTGYYRAIRLRDAQGAVRLERVAGPVPVQAPDWFVRLVPIASQPGVAQVSDGWKALGSVEVVSQPVFAYADLWRSARDTTAWMLLLGLAAAGVSTLVVRRLRRALGAVVEQARALTQRRYVRVPEPSAPELRRVAQAMNAMVERVHRQFTEQADEVAALRKQALHDPLTGVFQRAQFLARFAAELSREDGPAGGRLLLVRVLRLGEANQRLGHARTDQALLRLATDLGGPIREVTPVEVGRLNGSDFAVLLPLGAGAAGELAQALAAGLRARLQEFEDLAVALSVVGWRHGDDARAVLARADVALAAAEASGDFGCTVQEEATPQGPSGGEDSWRRGILAALQTQRVQMLEFPLIDRQGRLLHHECPLRLQLDEAAAALPAAHWLPLALRTGTTALVDERAVDLGLAAIGRDGQPRSINLSPASLQSPSFVAHLRERFAQQPGAARRLSLELDESALVHFPAAVADLCRQLRPFGVRVGLEHAGERLGSLRPLLESGLDFVKLAGSLGRDLGKDERRLALLRGTVQMLHGLGVAAYLEGVTELQDLPLIWAGGVDGVTGPAVTVR
ncbi:MAG: EAL domain-containing protein [Burkholderiaceae bacterium]|nr:EAL domain-containing protein [Burkholderiaceae bacterium]